MGTSYTTDVFAWSCDQARLIRSGKLDQLDLEHIAQEIEDVGKSEQREMASRMAVLLAHLLKWQFQPDKRSTSWRLTITEQRRLLVRRLQKMPSLAPMLEDPEWVDEIWIDAKVLAMKETGLDFDHFPHQCLWSLVQVLEMDWQPQG
jgi:hypothetical protein